MLKMSKTVICLFLILFLMSTVCFASDSPAIDRTAQATITIINNETGETEIIRAPVKVGSTSSTRSENGSIDEGCEVFIPIDSGISLYDEEGGTKTTGGVTATIHANYDLSSNNEQIRVNKIYGNWKPSSNIYTLSDREAGVNSGFGWGQSLNKYPTSNSFSYTTGWGYNDRATSEDVAPRCWSGATIHVVGMTATHDIYLEVPFGIYSWEEK